MRRVRFCLSEYVQNTTSTPLGDRYVEGGGKGPLVTHSSGNHAQVQCSDPESHALFTPGSLSCASGVQSQLPQAIALAAKVAGLQAFIVMPSNAPKVKVDAVKEYGATVVHCPPVVEERMVRRPRAPQRETASGTSGASRARGRGAR